MANDTPLTIVGNLTADPEMRFTPHGVAVAKFTVASTPRTFDKATGTWADGESMFLTCTVWRDLAEHVVESLTKGARVIVTGRLRQHHWEDKDTGQKRSMFGLDVDEIGPSLKWATATVKKATRSGPATAEQTPPDDPWPISSPAPAGKATSGSSTFADEPPF